MDSHSTSRPPTPSHRLSESHDFPDLEADSSFDWRDDTIIPALWMFPEEKGGTPPCTIVSMNARYDSAFHVRMGRALAEMRKGGILFICNGGAVHSLYRNNWHTLVLSGFNGNFQTHLKPAKWATDFAQAVGDVVNHKQGKLHKLGHREKKRAYH
jgi:aromatic ring-opening dioxygenase catalytic subunit (LigB family)